MSRQYGDMTWDSAEAPDGTAVGVRERPRSGRRAPRHADPLPGDLLPTIRLHGVRLHAITEKRCVDHILEELAAGRGGVVVTPNLDHLRRCTRDMSFGAIVAEADLVVADGMPLIWASRLQGTPLPQRVAGSDLISTLSAAAAERGRSIFLLGGAPGTADAAADVLRKNNPSLKLTGTYCPPVGFEHDDAEMKKIVSALAAAAPDIIFVALGSPKQEHLIQRIRQVLPGAWWLGVGISFSFLCGDVRRAPRWIQRLGLEWIHRLGQDPKRLFHRYVVVGIPFGASLLGRAVVRGLPQRFGRRPRIAAATAVTFAPAPDAMPHAAANGNGNGDGVIAEAVAPLAARPQRSRRRMVDAAGSPSAGRLGSLSHLRSMVLLGGSVRSSILTDSCDRSVLDFPLDADGSIFNHWLLHASELARYAGLEQLPVRVMVNRNAPEPASAAQMYYGKFRVERDLSEYRGTGGVLHDLAKDYADDDLVLVCNAAQILMDPLAAITTALDRKEGDVTLVSHNDGTPSGVMLVSVKTLRMIPETGFVDMKEQALPLIASKYDVTVMHCRRPTALPIRTFSDYIMAMRHYHRRRLGKPALSNPLAEDWQPAFAIIEQGATVDPRAHVHDSVVLKGGVVEPGGLAVRSIVCPGGVVRKDRPAVDQLVCAEGRGI
jgi:N-acetylglucosaminyldiphosphoundecaprenol N-acetyl-beta-D-mannosaminyltransferase